MAGSGELVTAASSTPAFVVGTLEPQQPVGMPVAALKDYLLQVVKLLNEQARAADAKAGAIVAVTSALVGWMLSASRGLPLGSRLLSWRESSLAVTLIVGATADVLAVLAVLPRAWSPRTPGSTFWKDILAQASPEAFWDQLSRQTAEALNRQLSDEVFVLSQILQRKFTLVRSAGWLALAAGVMAAVRAVFVQS